MSPGCEWEQMRALVCMSSQHQVKSAGGGKGSLHWLLQVLMPMEELCIQSFGRQRGGGGSGPLGQVISGPCSDGGHSCRWLVSHARTCGRLRRENPHATPWGGGRGGVCGGMYVYVTYNFHHNRLEIWETTCFFLLQCIFFPREMSMSLFSRFSSKHILIIFLKNEFPCPLGFPAKSLLLRFWLLSEICLGVLRLDVILCFFTTSGKWATGRTRSLTHLHEKAPVVQRLWESGWVLLCLSGYWACGNHTCDYRQYIGCTTCLPPCRCRTNTYTHSSIDYIIMQKRERCKQLQKSNKNKPKQPAHNQSGTQVNWLQEQQNSSQDLAFRVFGIISQDRQPLLGNPINFVKRCKSSTSPLSAPHLIKYKVLWGWGRRCNISKYLWSGNRGGDRVSVDETEQEKQWRETNRHGRSFETVQSPRDWNSNLKNGKLTRKTHIYRS